MHTRLLLMCVLLCNLGGTLARAEKPKYMTSPDPYVMGFQRGYQYIPFPVNEPYAPAKVPVYMYGYFGARSRHEPMRNQGFNDYIRDSRRGYVW